MRTLLSIIKYTVLFLLISLASGYIAFMVLSTSLTVEVPNLEGRSMKEASGSLDSIGLYINIENEEYSLAVAKGHIISQDVAPGSNIKGQSTVNVIISKGSEVRLIPFVIGKSVEETNKLFMKEELELNKIIYVHSDTVDEGVIIAQRPAPEEWTGESITLIASSGPYDVIYYSPFLKGMAKNDALLLATELGFNVELRQSTGTDIVIGQKPGPGIGIRMGDTIKLKLGRRQ
jgi:serine/threonine-protein kinase